MMMREPLTAPPPGIHHLTTNGLSPFDDQQQHWQQPAKSSPSQGWWAGPQHQQQASFGGLVASPSALHGYTPQMFFNNLQQFAAFAPNLRTNSFPAPSSESVFGHAIHRNPSQPQAGYFAAHHQQNSFLGHQHHQNQHNHPQHFGHEQHGLHGMHALQAAASSNLFNTHRPGLQSRASFGQATMSPWSSMLKQPMMHGSASQTVPGGRPRLLSRMSSGSVHPGYHAMQRHDSIIELSAPRGPPRKPRQSGFALWVGNLPYDAQLIELKDHFSRDAREDIESLCLLPASSCAFVNYRSEEAVHAAQVRFNGSAFGQMRLLCRVRNGKEQKLSGRASPIAKAPGTPVEESATSVLDVAEQLTDLDLSTNANSGEAMPETALSTKEPRKDRYFIVKSLTNQDLQVSRKNGLWETQPHNRKVLDDAFDSAENVYLIFSVNKSGEYSGYARMTSRSFEQAVTAECATGAVEIDHNAGLTITPTEATETAPKGRIVEDAIRGTLFWEADREGEAEGGVALEPHNPDEPPSRQFRVEWQSMQSVPFKRTKGMRNAWNDNKEVKIARDGTELEPECGKHLVSLFTNV